MAKTVNKVMERVVEFRDAWEELAPDATFAGMTFAEFEVAIAPPLTVRAEIAALEKTLINKKTERLIVDEAANELLELVVNSVRGTPGYGADSVLYRAFGYVRKSDRKSGLTRRAVKPSGTPAADADAA